MNPPNDSDEIWFRDASIAPQDTVSGFNAIVAALKQLAKGRYPRADVVPTALHAYNRCQAAPGLGLYIHPVTPIEYRAKEKIWKGFGGEVPILRLPEAVLTDLERRTWIPVHERSREALKRKIETDRKSDEAKRDDEVAQQSHTIERKRREGRNIVKEMEKLEKIAKRELAKSWTQTVENKAHYRFLCFVHEHRLTLTGTAGGGGSGGAQAQKRTVFTVSIYDCEKKAVFWHDMWGPAERRERRAVIMKFWKKVQFYGPAPPALPPGFEDDDDDEEDPQPSAAKTRGFQVQPPSPFEIARWTEFSREVEYRTSYHTARHMESMLRGPLNPRHSLYAVIGAVMHYIDRGAARDPYPEFVPDKPGVFAGHDIEVLPRLFTHLLLECLDSRRLAAAEGEVKGKGKRVVREEEEEENRREAFLKQLRIPNNAEWMRYGTRKHLTRRLGNTEQARQIREALRIPQAPTHQREIP